MRNGRCWAGLGVFLVVLLGSRTAETGIAAATGSDPVAATEQGSESQTTDPARDSPSTDGLSARVERIEEAQRVLEDSLEQRRLEQIVQDAQAEAAAAEQQPVPEEREFLEGGRALQRLNPEVTFCADLLGTAIFDGSNFYASEHDRTSLAPRGVGLHIQHVLDPYSLFKSALHFSPDGGVGVEEVYVSWFGVTPSLSLTAGRFRQTFGVLNRWHEHDLDQTQHPLALRLVLGDEGLVGNGLSARWMMPSLWADANELTLEIVDGDNPTLFSGEHFSAPSTLLHLKSYYDLNQATYLELGLTGDLGFNNRRGAPGEDGLLVNEPWRRTLVGGADLTLSWQPLQQARYRSFTWRTEAFLADRQVPGDRPAMRTRRSWGAYSYIQAQVATRVFIGLRGDLALPTDRISSERVWAVTPYLTFWQSEFVYMRLELQHGHGVPATDSAGGLIRRNDNRVLLQLDFAAGPHKHEKY